eukprot:3093423-Pyramimonas_sp.AAC.1
MEKAADPTENRDCLSTLFTAFAEILNACSAACCQSESIRIITAEFTSARSSFTAGVKFNALENAMDAFIGAPCEGHGVQLASCVEELRGNELPEPIAFKLDTCAQTLMDSGLLLDKEVIYAKWMVILKGVGMVKKTSALAGKWSPIISLIGSWKAAPDSVRALLSLGSAPEFRQQHKLFDEQLKKVQAANHHFTMMCRKASVVALISED